MTHDTFPLDEAGRPDGLMAIHQQLRGLPPTVISLSGEPTEELGRLAHTTQQVQANLVGHYGDNFDGLVQDTADTSPIAGSLAHLMVYSSINYASPRTVVAEQVEQMRDNELVFLKAFVLQGLIKSLATLEPGKPFILTTHNRIRNIVNERRIAGGIIADQTPNLAADPIVGHLVFQTPLVRPFAPQGEIPIFSLAHRGERGIEERHHLIEGEEAVKQILAAQIPRAKQSAANQTLDLKSELVLIDVVESAARCGIHLADCNSPEELQWAKEQLMAYAGTNSAAAEALAKLEQA